MSDIAAVKIGPNEEPSGYAFIGAVHKLVSRQTNTTRADLFLAAAMQALSSGDKTAAEVAAVMNRIWPAANASPQDAADALLLGKELGLVFQQEALDTTRLWSLSGSGQKDVAQQALWVKELRDRATEDLRQRAERDIPMTVPRETAELWLDELVRALIKGISASQAAYLGEVTEIVGRKLMPRGISLPDVVGGLSNTGNSIVMEFLRAMCVAALDPLDPFGSDLVSHVTTGCVLHSYVAGRDHAAVLADIGVPDNQRALIDTPVLLDLVGPRRVQRRAWQTIDTAVEARWDVIVAEHSLEELKSLLEREIPNVKEAFRDANERGIKEEWYASLVDQQLPSLCIESLKDGTYNRLEEMLSTAEELWARLVEHGVAVRPHYNEQDDHYVRLCRTALEKDLGHMTRRSPAVVQRDADSMAMIWRRRRRQRGTQWPGGWVITTDRHMTPAFRGVEPGSPVSLTLSMAQWGTLLSVTVPPTEVVELAEAAASQLIEEAMWLIPSRYPSETAMGLAYQLSPHAGGTELDFRAAQITLEGSLDEGGAERSAVSLAAEVLAARTLRTDQLHGERIQAADARRVEAERQALLERTRADQQAGRAEGLQAKVNEAATAAEVQQAELAWARAQPKRIAITVLLILASVAGLIVCFVVGGALWLSFCFGIALITAVLFGVTWCTERQARFTKLLIPTALEALGAVSAGIDLWSSSGLGK